MAGSTEWRTPPAFFEKLDAEFGFNVDAAATRENALGCGRLTFYTAETDGTKPEHYGPGDIVWCNPPYSPAALVYRFIETAFKTSKLGATWVMLLNASTTETRWFHNFIWDREFHRSRDRIEVRFLKGRVAFHGVLNTPIPAPRYSNMLVVFRPPLEAK